ncbi:MAG: hypothetical protein M1819_005393 [Sarea resinae]|nr:MAG: hypothetical protein M1819_005393 [Sarea resinae]
MTVALQEHLFVKIVACYVALGFVVIEISFFFVYCRPFSQYWAFPVHNPQCANFRNYCITQMVFNVSSDALLLAIPLPLLLKSQLPPKKKALLVAVFSLGVFVMLAAILNKCYNFTMPNTTIYMVWHIREASTSIYVANLMCWWPLLRFLFGFRSFSGGPSSRSGAPGSKIGSSNLSRPKSGVFTRWRRRLHTRQLSGIGRNTTLERLGSQEAINTPRNQAPDIEAANAQNVPLEIWQKVEFDVDNYDIRPDGTPVNPRAYNYPLSGTKGYDPAVIVKRARDDFN